MADQETFAKKGGLGHLANALPARASRACLKARADSLPLCLTVSLLTSRPLPARESARTLRPA